MPEKVSHATYMAEAIYEYLHALHYTEGVHVKTMARWAGCSTSLVYRWVPGEKLDRRGNVQYETPRADYLLALALSVARERGDRTVIDMITPAEPERPAYEANGLFDELEDSAVASGNLVHASRAESVEGLRGLAEMHRELAKRILAEAGALEAARRAGS